MSQFIAIAKLEYVPVSDPDDEVVPGNIGALKKGLEALTSEDARDNQRANMLWSEGKELLALDQADETGSGAEGRVQISDDTDVHMLGMGL